MGSIDSIKDNKNEVLKDIQIMLIAWFNYLDDMSTKDPWDERCCLDFIAMCRKYGFNKDNLFKGYNDY